ncbi:MAG: hypothetical protein PHV42_01620 [Candidatus Pacebacteria bacterium]|nr:hypothetical protein [Candidatus Paceibacterota bacterium]
MMQFGVGAVQVGKPDQGGTRVMAIENVSRGIAVVAAEDIHIQEPQTTISKGTRGKVIDTSDHSANHCHVQFDGQPDVTMHVLVDLLNNG